MKRFILHLINFSLLLVVLFTFYIFFLKDFSFHPKKAANSIFIWGDSQAYHGLNLTLMKKLSGKEVYSAAKPGAGVYNFLAFSENVPDNATVIVAISKPVQLRPLTSDRNSSSISLNTLKTLYENNYKATSLFFLLRKHLTTKKDNYLTAIPLYPASDTVKYIGQVPIYETIYKKTPSYLKDKQNIYKQGISNLIAKNCSITFVEFPFHQIAKDIENKSEVKESTEQFKLEVMGLFDKSKIDTIRLNTSKIVMHDLSHLNKNGATQTTQLLMRKMKEGPYTTMYIITN